MTGRWDNLLGSWPYLVPMVFVGAIAFHHLHTVMGPSTPDTTKTPITTVVDLPVKPIAAPPPPLAPEQSDVKTVRAKDVPHARAPQPVRIPSRPSTISVDGSGTAAPPASDLPRGQIISIVGDASGLHVQRVQMSSSPTATTSTSAAMPTGTQLDAMEFVIDVASGSLEELVRNVDGAFFRNRRLYDTKGNAVASMSRYQSGSRLIVFFAVDGGSQIVLPTAVVDAVLRQVMTKSPLHTPRRVIARFDAAGALKNVDVEA